MYIYNRHDYKVDKQKLYILIQQFRDNTISDEDLHELKLFVKQEDSNLKLMEVLDEWEALVPDADVTSSASEDLFHKISLKVNSVGDEYRVRRLRNGLVTKLSWVAAALLICTLSVIYYSRVVMQDDDQPPHAGMVSTPIMPGGSKAKVLLEDGRVIDLESMKNDTTIVLNGYSIHKDVNGLLSYNIAAMGTKDKILYNTIITPKNGEYSVMLADGTTIWVNSSSELRYPLNFGEESRTVHLKGEAYFEVAKRERKGGLLPFVVHTGGQELKVLGTSFNVNGKFGNIETTLVEGAVQLSYDNGEKYVLKPNQQAVFQVNKNEYQINEIDPFYTVAWKNGIFAFDNKSIKEVMDILSEWYNVQVEYQGDVSNVFFTGTMSRYADIQKVLKLIEITGSVRFKTEERRIIVMQ